MFPVGCPERVMVQQFAWKQVVGIDCTALYTAAEPTGARIPAVWEVEMARTAPHFNLSGGNYAPDSGG
jgi:hypothetical protein